jgi:hypothetical protein
MSIFKFISDRDVFIQAYSSNLAERLLQKTSLSSENEISLLNKLKIECGVNTVSKISKMFNDMNESKELDSKF